MPVSGACRQVWMTGQAMGRAGVTSRAGRRRGVAALLLTVFVVPVAWAGFDLPADLRAASVGLLEAGTLIALLVLWVWTLRRSVAARTRQLQLWAHAFKHAAFAMAIFDTRTRRIVEANPAFARERGYTSEGMAGMHVDALYPEELVEERRVARRESDRREHSVMESEHLARDGRRFPVLLDCSNFRDSAGAARYAIVYAQDTTERKRIESELRLAAVAFQSQAALMVMDANRVIQRVNHAFSQLTGYRAEEAIGKPSSLLRSRHHDTSFYDYIWNQIHSEGFWQGEQWIQVKQGQPRVIRTAVSAVTDASSQTTHYVWSMIDLTGEREAHASVDRMTFFDSLTDLPNRHFLQGRLEHLLDDSQARGGALLMFDLDHSSA